MLHWGMLVMDLTMWKNGGIFVMDKYMFWYVCHAVHYVEIERQYMCTTWGWGWGGLGLWRGGGNSHTLQGDTVVLLLFGLHTAHLS